jgi:hypothetical protein
VGDGTHEREYWLIEPLLAVGMPLEDIRSLVFRLGFEGVVGADEGGAASVQWMVGTGRPRCRPPGRT